MTSVTDPLFVMCCLVSLMLVVSAVFAIEPSAMGGIHVAKPPGVPPVKYMSPGPPDVQAPRASGQYYQAMVPDTCDLAEVARLFLEHYLTEITAANPELYHEPFNRCNFVSDPARLSLDIGSYNCALPKFREALPLLRAMTGSEKGMEIDQAWAEHFFRCIGPDGLFYVPRVGRPWDGDQGQGLTGAGYVWGMPEKAEFYADLPLSNGRLLSGLAVYYELSGDERWKTAGEGVVDGLSRLAVRLGNIAFFTRFQLQPGQTLSAEEAAQAAATWRSRYENAMKTEHWEKHAGESPDNTGLWQTWIIQGLAHFYGATGYEPAKELAYRLVNHLRQIKYVEDWKSHFHCISLGIHAMLELAIACNDRELAEYARKAYDEGTSGKNFVAFPKLGFFVNTQGDKVVEGCSIGDAVALACKLAGFGMGDRYYEDADRYIRNALTGIQRTEAEQISRQFDRLAREGVAKPCELKYSELADRLPERMVGSFASSSYPNDRFGGTYFDTCCQGNIARALFYAWNSILSYADDELSIHLLLNRASQWADIASHIPYAGRVEVKVKRAIGALELRVPYWVQKDKVRCAMDGQDIGFEWQDNYIRLSNVAANSEVVVTFPMIEVTEKQESFIFKYQVTLRGNEAIDIQPRGKNDPIFVRPHFRTGIAPIVSRTRFICDKVVKH